MDEVREGTCAAAADLLVGIEQALEGDRGAQRGLGDATRLLGEYLGAARVVLYGDSDAGDDAVRVRSQWHAPDVEPLTPFAAPLPLLTWRPVEREIVSAWPRGEHCPSDCMTTAVGCPLRSACASIVEPLRVGDRRYGRLGVHARTNRAWTPDEQQLVRMVAARLALHVAHLRVARLQHELEAQRRGIAMTVLHQVATPVSVIDGALDHVARHGSEGSGALLEAAGAAIERLRRLCDDLVAINAGSGTGATRRDVRRELAAVIDAARRRHSAVAISLDAPPELPLVRTADGDVARVLDALIDNAVRYGGAAARVSVVVWSDDEVLTIRVRDDGPGLPSDSLDVVGAAFSRRDPSMRNEPGGAGLGLALASSIARRDGGDLHLEPRRDAAGAQATLCLPLASVT
jgi:K+-sensing histidine kinase KdpD